VIRVRGYYRRDGTWVSPHERRSRGRRRTKQPTSTWPGIPAQRRSPSQPLRHPMSEALRKRLVDETKVKAAADYCADVIENGAVAATAERVADHVSKEAWKRLKRRWRRRRCRWLNEIAEAILAAKKKYHALTASLLTSLLGRAFGHKAENAFVRELATSIPLPGDAKFVALAQGIRIVGVGLCVAQYGAPEQCYCFEALALRYGKEATKKLLIAEGDMWMKDASGQSAS
jgi:hypothetical protein